ncbi:MAG: chemotaxis protein CheA [Verrucomicrobiaceae bacterium]|nr:chemotaxis protein CheA [Verrucomicrobiaceae bacterium]
MSVHIIREQKRTRLIFAGALTIYETGSVRNTMLDVLSESRPIEMDLAGVTEIDMSGVQLLLTLRGESNLQFVAGTNTVVTRTLLQLLNLQQSLEQHTGNCRRVIKPLGQLLRGVSGFSGSTILGDGSVALLLDVPTLLAHASRCDGELTHALKSYHANER